MLNMKDLTNASKLMTSLSFFSDSKNFFPYFLISNLIYEIEKLFNWLTENWLFDNLTTNFWNLALAESEKEKGTFNFLFQWKNGCTSKR